MRKLGSDIEVPLQERILRLGELKIRVGLARSTIYNYSDPKSSHFDPSFPRRIKIGDSAVGWLESEVNAWILSKIRAR